MVQPLTLMVVHAHPDDEVIGTGGVLARSAAEGAHTVVVTCTRGEVGEIATGTDATPATLADHREAELRTACGLLGVQDLCLLGYRDSGMAGRPDNDHPACFLRADLGEATGLTEAAPTSTMRVTFGDRRSGRWAHASPRSPAGADTLAKGNNHDEPGIASEC